MCGAPLTHLYQTRWNLNFFIISIPFFQMTVFKLSHSTSMLLILMPSTICFRADAPLSLQITCLPISLALAAQDFLLTLILFLFSSLMQGLTSTFTFLYLLLVVSGTLPKFVFPPSYDLNTFNRGASVHLLN